MANETSVGGIIAPVQADISDFMRKFDQVDQQTNKVSANVINKLEMMSSALRDVTAQANALNIKEPSVSSNSTATNNGLAKTLQFTDSIKQSKQQIAAIDRNLFDQLQKNNQAETTRTAELRRQKSEIEGQLAALKSSSSSGLDSSIKSTAKNVSLLNEEFGKIKSHIMWMATATISGAAVMTPFMMVDKIKEMEQAMAGVRQVLPSLEGDQNAVNTELINFTKIASKYGESTMEVIDAGRSWGRMYKDVNVVNLLVAQSAKMATADNFSMKDSVKGLESAMSQFGMKSENVNEVMKNSNKILDVWTKLAHTGGASAQDLVAGVERAGSTAYQAGMSFEFYNAMIATGVRNTALSGSEIGNSMKSLAINFKTDKAISEMDKFGVAVKKVDQDGKVTFRSMQDVILDLSLAVQNTDKDTSKLFSSLFGKFQNSKLTSIVTDYKQIIDNWQNAVNSSNFTDEQVALQLDTISRKIGTTKAILDELAAGAGNSGLTNFIKEQISSINNFLTGLTAMSSNMVSAIGTTIKWSAELYLVTKVLTSITEGVKAVKLASEAYVAVKAVDTTVTVINTEAKIAENIATANLNRTIAVSSAIRGNIIPLLILGTAAMYSYNESVGEANNKIQKQSDNEAVRLEQMQRSADSIKQQSEFINTLANSYDKQSEALQNAGENTEKGQKIQEEMTFLEKKLTEELNINSAAQDENAGNIIENGKVNRTVIDNNIKAKELHSAQLAESLLKDADNLRNEALYHKNLANSKIKDMENEITMLGFLERAYLAYFNFMADMYNKMADYQEQSANETDDFTGVSVEKTPEQKQKILENAKKYREKSAGYQQKRTSTAENYIGISQMLRDSNTEALEAMKIQTNYVAQNTKMAGIVDPSGKKGKGSSSNAPQDRTENIQSKVDFLELDKIINSIEIFTDNYNESLNKIKTSEELYGVTIQTNTDRMSAMHKQLVNLKDAGDAVDKLKQTNIDKINSFADKTGATVSISGGNSTPEGTAFNYLSNAGYKPEMVAGIIGNLMTESGLNPTALAGDGSGSYGIGQWLGGRLDGLYDFAKNNNSDVNALETQLAYLVYEMQHNESGSIDKVMASGSTTPEEFALAVSKYYERPAWAENPERQQNSRNVYSKYISGELNGTPEEININGDTLNGAGIDSATWKSATSEQKVQLVQSHHDQMQNADLLIKYLQEEIKREKKLSGIKANIAKQQLAIVKSGIEDTNNLISASNTEAEQWKTQQLLKYGVGVTQEQKDKLDLDVFNKRLETLKRERDRYADDPKSVEYKKLNDDYAKLIMQRDTMQKLTIPNTKYQTNVANVGYDQQIKSNALGTNYTKEQKDIIDLVAANEKLRLAEQSRDTLENAGKKDSAEYKEKLVLIGQLKNEILALNDKTLVVRTSMASMFDGMMRGTTTFSQFWRNACLDFGTQMINQIWNINQAGRQSSLIGNIFGGLFGGSTYSSTSGINATAKANIASQYFPSTTFSIAGKRENGGSVIAGQTYLVGEKRPELFVPTSNGTIIPDLSTIRANNANANTSANTGNVQHVAVNIKQNYQSLDPATNMKLQKAQNASMKSEILNAIRTETTWRSAVKGAAR